MIHTLPIEARPLLKEGEYAICYAPGFAKWIARNSGGHLVAAQSGQEIWLVKTEAWVRIQADVQGIVAEVEARTS